MSAQETPPVESWWSVGGVDDAWERNPDAGKIGRFVGYVTVENVKLCAIQICPSGDIIHKLPHALFPAGRPADADAMPSPPQVRAGAKGRRRTQRRVYG